MNKKIQVIHKNSKEGDTWFLKRKQVIKEVDTTDGVSSLSLSQKMDTPFSQLVETKHYRIAIVAARFNHEIVDGLIEGALCALGEHGVDVDCLELVRTPGAFELPLTAQQWLKANTRFSIRGVIALGAIIKGETAHFEYVAGPATEALMQVSLQEEKPIANGLLTTYTLEQARARAHEGASNEGKEGDGNKGYEAAIALLESLNVLTSLNRSGA